MPRNAYARIHIIHDLAGRIDYIGNPDRQEHLFTTYSTVEDNSFWEELAQVNQTEHIKYGAGGKAIEAREWIIALDESLIELDSDMVIRKFVDAFHDKYGVECKAGLHHNSAQTNYHIHMLFSERQLLETPIEKVATRNMFYDEKGKHRRTKKEILDSDGNIRPGCKIVAKGEVYERQLFSEKNAHFKSTAFRKEVQELFKDINNSLITDEDRKLSIFNPDGVYLATKKVGKNNPMAEFIIADNEQRMEWNRSVDQALIALVDRNLILDVKRNNIQNEIRKSIAENGKSPSLFAGIVKKAVDIVKDMMMKAFEKLDATIISEETTAPVINSETVKIARPKKIPPKPQKPSGIDNYDYLLGIYNKIKRYSKTIRNNETTIKSLEKAANACTSVFQIFEKREYEKEIKKLKSDNEGAHLMQEKIISQYGYTSVDAFMTLYWKTKNSKESYEKKLSEWNEKYGNYSEEDIETKKNIKERIEEGRKKSRENNKCREPKNKVRKYDRNI